MAATLGHWRWPVVGIARELVDHLATPILAASLVERCAAVDMIQLTVGEFDQSCLGGGRLCF